MALKSGLFQGSGAGFDRLRKCLESHAFHIKEGQSGPGQAEAVRLIQTALNLVNNAGLTVDGSFGRLTGDAVFAYKNSRSPKILGPGQTIPDRIVGIGTLTQLDLDLLKKGGGGGGGGRRKGLVDPPADLSKPIDMLVHISGFVVPGGNLVNGSRGGSGFIAHDPMMRIADRAGRTRHFVGLEGSLVRLDGVAALALDIIGLVNTASVRTLIIYGYSAGGSNALELSRVLDANNRAAPMLGLKPVQIDLLITVDAAERPDSPLKVNRRVGGCVKTHVNFFQTQASPGGGARGDVATSSPSTVLGLGSTFMIQKDVTDEMTGNPPLFSKHARIEKLTLARCLQIMEVELGP